MIRHLWPLLSLSALVACGSDFVVTENEGRLIVSPPLVDEGILLVDTQNAFIVNLMAVDAPVKIVAADVRNIEGDAFSIVTTEMPQINMDETAILDLTYNPTDVGYHWAEVIIQTDEKDTPSHLIRMRGAAADPAALLSPTLIDFGPVTPGSQGEATLTLANTGLVTVSVAGASTTTSLFTSDVYETDVDPGTDVTFNLTFTPVDLAEATDVLTFDVGDRVSLEPVKLRGNACSTASGGLYDQDADGVGWCGNDCDDQDPEVHPGTAETCDGKDNDCDGTIDEGTECYDDDMDGYSETDGDCNDADPMVSPTAVEDLTNGIDDNCDSYTDLGFNDADGDGYSAAGGDCDDYDTNTHPGALELSDAIDNDCDGTIDEGTEVYDDDGDGYTELDGDCNDADLRVNPGAEELSNWVDDDCDGVIDDGTANSDDDSDGYSERGGDCDDTDASISPAAIDVVGDGIDSDCDGTDE